jgi:excisionase family DNA binding protein
MPAPDEFLTVAEIAAELKMNEQSIRNWIDSGYLPAIRIGRLVRVNRSDFDALLEASYTGTMQLPAGVWDGEVPTPVAPGAHVQAGEPEPDNAAERQAG